MKNRKGFENPEKCTLIKHFIKELIRTHGSAFCGNPQPVFFWKSEKI